MADAASTAVHVMTYPDKPSAAQASNQHTGTVDGRANVSAGEVAAATISAKVIYFVTREPQLGGDVITRQAAAVDPSAESILCSPLVVHLHTFSSAFRQHSAANIKEAKDSPITDCRPVEYAAEDELFKHAIIL